MIIYRAGFIGFEVDLIILQGFAHKPTPILKWSSHGLTVAHIYIYVCVIYIYICVCVCVLFLFWGGGVGRKVGTVAS